MMSAAIRWRVISGKGVILDGLFPQGVLRERPSGTLRGRWRRRRGARREPCRAARRRGAAAVISLVLVLANGSLDTGTVTTKVARVVAAADCCCRPVASSVIPSRLFVESLSLPRLWRTLSYSGDYRPIGETDIMDTLRRGKHLWPQAINVCSLWLCHKQIAGCEAACDLLPRASHR
jgi:hypothetical protein